MISVNVYGPRIPATEERRCEKVGWRDDSADEIREERVAGGSGKINQWD